MKRFLLIAILLFPLLTLLWWVYWGFTRPHTSAPPPAVTNTDTNAAPAPR